MTTILIAVIVWFIVSLPLGLLFGPMLRAASQRDRLRYVEASDLALAR